MESGLVEVNQSLPVMEEKTGDLVVTVKWLLYLVAALVALHAGYVLLEPIAVAGLKLKHTASRERRRRAQLGCGCARSTTE